MLQTIPSLLSWPNLMKMLIRATGLPAANSCPQSSRTLKPRLLPNATSSGEHLHQRVNVLAPLALDTLTRLRLTKVHSHQLNAYCGSRADSCSGFYSTRTSFIHRNRPA
jgi:hypothetical protein